MAALLGLQAAFLFAYGGWCAWARQADGDMASRAAEYSLFRVGIYPNAWLEQVPIPFQPHYTVYPPYAFPLFAFFFEPGGIVQGRFLIEALSLASAVVMGIVAYRVLLPYGHPLAWVGAVAGAAIAGNGTALSLGQFSILCVGLIVQQMIFLERRKPLAAGVCWALAMLKPQIALPFLALFALRRQMRGAIVGVLLLAALTLATCQWTGVSLGAIVDYWGRGMSLRFAEQGGGISPGGLAKNLGIDQRTMQFIALAVMAAMLVPAVSFIQRLGHGAMLPVAALCSVCGMLGFYHRHYDNVMLFPAMLAIIHAAAESPRGVTVGAAIAMLGSVLIPKRLLQDVPFHEAVQAVIWLVAAAIPFATAVRRSRKGSDEAHAY